MKKEGEKRKRENRARKREEKIIFLYFCTQKVKKRGKSKPKKRKSAKTRNSHIPVIQRFTCNSKNVRNV